jgi:DNA-binding LacI/PurR family transcriptional regulator
MRGTALKSGGWQGRRPSVVVDGRLATMSDVARLAGVSAQTVSRVLKGSPAVAVTTRKRVEEAVTQLRYRPNPSARALATRRTMNLGVVSVGHAQWGPAVALFGIADAARRAGYGTSLAALDEVTRDSMGEALEHLAAVAVDGIIVIAPVKAAVAASEWMSSDVPVVFFEPGADNGTTIVGGDEVLAARLATRHLLELGHETVWHVSGPDGWLGTEARIRGWQAELAAGRAVSTERLIGDWGSGSGYRAGQELAKMDSVSAVFAANDQMALGVLKALREAGRSVPDDVSVVGFDDIPEAAFFQPALTTVRLDFTAIGRRCVARLLGMIEGRAVDVERFIDPQLIVRDTTAPPSWTRTAKPARGVGRGSSRTS